ncbi:MAG: hypothetical protein U1E78_04890 [Gammaproteobacteria bacterium]
MIKYLIKQFIKRFRSPSLGAIKLLNRGLRKLVAFTHKCQFYCEWAIKPNPEWCDHFLDQYYTWHELRNPLGWERGIFNLLSIKENATILELCCGDGFNAYHFYSIRAKHIIYLKRFEIRPSIC